RGGCEVPRRSCGYRSEQRKWRPVYPSWRSGLSEKVQGDQPLDQRVVSGANQEIDGASENQQAAWSCG
ncbi:hypothetical protein B8W95_13200, partial [Staphylococcus pasteuri]